MVAVLESRITRVATPLRLLSALSIFTRSSRCRLIEATARGSSSRAWVMAGFCLFSAIASRLRLSMARTIWSLFVSSWPMNVSSWASTERTLPSRPASAELSSAEIVFSCATPPPLSSSERAPSTSSTSGLRPLRSSGIRSPSDSRPSPVPPPGGGARETNFSPSRLVCRMVASASSGSLTLRRISTVTSAW